MKQVPFFRLLIPFIAGIALSLNLNIPFSSFQLFYALLTLLVLYFLSIFFAKVWQYRWITGIAIMLFLFVAGIAIVHNKRGQSAIKEGKNQKVIVRLLEPTDGRTSSYRAIGKVEWQQVDGAWMLLNEKVMLYFSAIDSAAAELRYGSVIAANANFSAIPSALNPEQFDYREFLAKKQVFRTAFIPANNWLIADVRGNPAQAFAFTLRDRLLGLYQKVGIEGENLAVLSALTMGYKSLLDEETKRVFSASGAMHILAVSGLHVGILFFTISFFLFFLGRIKKGKIIKAVALIFFLWFFAIFTGLSPSVIRACMMFSLVIIGTALSRRTSIYNTISASAFVILSINPMLITEVGFLLSYFAVLSIVFFYPHIYGLIYVKNRWLDKVWALMAVSISAQLGTFAIGLYYFNQFPNYFILTNLYAIPLAFVILYLSIGLILFSPIPYVITAIGWMLDKSLSFLNWLINFTEALPFSTSTGLAISLSQMFLLFGTLLLIAIFLERKGYYALLGALGCLLLFFVENAYIKLQQSKQNEMVVFSVRNSTAIGFTQGNSFTLAISDSINNPWQTFAYNINGYLNKKGLTKRKDFFQLNSKGNNTLQLEGIYATKNSFGVWIAFAEHSIFIPFGKGLDDFKVQNPLAVNVLILGNRSQVELGKLLKILNPDIVVLDSSIPRWKIDDIETFLFEQGVKYHAVDRSGAFILKGLV